jgi:peroxiredoxin
MKEPKFAGQVGRPSDVRMALAAALSLALAGACGNDPADPSDLRCGPGTQLVGDECVPSNNLACGPGTQLVGDECVPSSNLACGPGTVAVDGECLPGVVLEPGHFLAPLVPLDEVADVGSHTDEIHIRTEDNLLLNCSYTFNVIDAADPSRMRVLSSGNRHVIPGETQQPGCKHMAWDGNLVFTTHLGNIRDPNYLSGWDITDPRAPVQLPVLREEGIAYEGIAVANGNIFVGLHENGLGVYDYDATSGFTRVGTLAEGFTNAWGVAARGNHVFIADGLGGFAIVDATDPAAPVEVGRVQTGGQARGVVVDGDFAYVAAGSAGVAIVNISDPAAPAIAGRIDMPGTALRVAFSAPHLAVAAWNDARVYDVSTPATPRFVAAVRVPRHFNYADKDRELPTHRIFGVAIRDKDLFVGAWENPYSYRLAPERLAPNIRLPETTARLDFGKLAVGESRTVPFEVTNQGTAPLTLVENWIHGDAFSVTPKQARIQPNESVTLELTYKATSAELEVGYLNVVSDDPQAPVRKAYLTGNSPGLTIGDPLPATTGVMLDATSWSSTESQGKVLLLTYFGTFCPVCANHLPDIEARYFQAYKDQGLEVVALNPREADDPIEEVQAYIERIRVTYATGIEEPADTYSAITANFVGPNPFPVDVLVDKQGIVRYATHEYDPEAMTAMIEQLLAEP